MYTLQPTGTEDSVTSTEFERFLAERAAAAESLPTTTATVANTSTTQSAKKDSKDNMFAL